MIRTAGRLALAALPLLAACDFSGDDVMIEPEYDLTYAFESGLDAWLPDATDLDDPPVDWDVGVSSEAAISTTLGPRAPWRPSFLSAPGSGRRSRSVAA